MDQCAASKLLSVIEPTPEIEDLDLPHTLIVIDPVSHRIHTRGRYVNGLEAAAAAVQLKEELDRIEDGAEPFRVIPTPIYEG